MESELVRLGVERELGEEAYRTKRPQLVTGAFDFERFSKIPTFALAQSVFTHLAPSDIAICMARLHAVVRPGCRFFVSLLEGDYHNPRRSHPHTLFSYTQEQMQLFGESVGWTFHYIGDWGHPKNQLMVEYVAR